MMKKATLIFLIFPSFLYSQEKMDFRVVLAGTITAAFAVNSLQDGINFTKAPKGQDLRHLWHGAKYAHVGLTLATGILNVLTYQQHGWKQALIWDAIGFVAGAILWRVTYPLYRRVNWGSWA